MTRWVVAVALTLLSGPLESQGVVRIPFRPSCSDCRLVATRLFTLSQETVSSNVLIAADSRGTLYLGSDGFRGEVRVIDTTGKVRRIMKGPSPGRTFGQILAVFMGVGDSLHVVDATAQRDYVFATPALQVARDARVPIAYASLRMLFLPKGGHILSANVPTPGSVAFPLHHVANAGDLTHSFGEEVRTGDMYDRRLRRYLALTDSSRFWSARHFEYRLDLWSTNTFELIRSYEVVLPGFEPEYSGPVIPADRPPAAFIENVSVQPEGVVWVSRFGPDRRYQSSIREAISESGKRLHVIGDFDTYYDGFIDVLDMSKGRLIATSTFDVPLRLIRPGLYFSHRKRNAVYDGVDIWRVHVKKP
jgi:hypothetical protein